MKKNWFVFICVIVISFSCLPAVYCETAKECFQRGVEYGKKGDLDKAIAEFDKAIQLAPGNAQPYFNRGFAYECKRDLGKALVDYSKTIELNPSHVNAYNNRAIVYFYMDQYDKSWADVHKAESLGNRFDLGFVESLKKASGREK